MTFVARAKTPGRCVIRDCLIPGSRIYQGSAYRYLACSIAHAAEADRLVTEAIARLDETAQKNISEPFTTE